MPLSKSSFHCTEKMEYSTFTSPKKSFKLAEGTFKTFFLPIQNGHWCHQLVWKDSSVELFQQKNKKQRKKRGLKNWFHCCIHFVLW